MNKCTKSPLYAAASLILYSIAPVPVIETASCLHSVTSTYSAYVDACCV